MIRLQNIKLTPPKDIQRLANNHAIAVNLRDAFPYPYTLEDAITYLDLAANGVLGHGIGEPYWGKGFATDAVRPLLSPRL